MNLLLVDDVAEKRTGLEVLLLQKTRRAEMDGMFLVCVSLSPAVLPISIRGWIFVAAVTQSSF